MAARCSPVKPSQDSFCGSHTGGPTPLWLLPPGTPQKEMPQDKQPQLSFSRALALVDGGFVCFLKLLTFCFQKGCQNSQFQWQHLVFYHFLGKLCSSLDQPRTAGKMQDLTHSKLYNWRLHSMCHPGQLTAALSHVTRDGLQHSAQHCPHRSTAALPLGKGSAAASQMHGTGDRAQLSAHSTTRGGAVATLTSVLPSFPSITSGP